MTVQSMCSSVRMMECLLNKTKIRELTTAMHHPVIEFCLNNTGHYELNSLITGFTYMVSWVGVLKPLTFSGYH